MYPHFWIKTQVIVQIKEMVMNNTRYISLTKLSDLTEYPLKRDWIEIANFELGVLKKFQL
jgi:hypothetical protein